MRYQLVHYLGGLLLSMILWVAMGMQPGQSQTIKEMINERNYY
jgi:hypothetical protein